MTSQGRNHTVQYSSRILNNFSIYFQLQIWGKQKPKAPSYCSMFTSKNIYEKNQKAVVILTCDADLFLYATVIAEIGTVTVILLVMVPYERHAREI